MYGLFYLVRWFPRPLFHYSCHIQVALETFFQFGSMYVNTCILGCIFEALYGMKKIESEIYISLKRGFVLVSGSAAMAAFFASASNTYGWCIVDDASLLLKHVVYLLFLVVQGLMLIYVIFLLREVNSISSKQYIRLGAILLSQMLMVLPIFAFEFRAMARQGFSPSLVRIITFTFPLAHMIDAVLLGSQLVKPCCKASFTRGGLEMSQSKGSKRAIKSFGAKGEENFSRGQEDSDNRDGPEEMSPPEDRHFDQLLPTSESKSVSDDLKASRSLSASGISKATSFQTKESTSSQHIQPSSNKIEGKKKPALRESSLRVGSALRSKPNHIRHSAKTVPVSETKFNMKCFQFLVVGTLFLTIPCFVAVCTLVYEQSSIFSRHASKASTSLAIQQDIANLLFSMYNESTLSVLNFPLSSNHSELPAAIVSARNSTDAALGALTKRAQAVPEAVELSRALDFLSGSRNGMTLDAVRMMCASGDLDYQRCGTYYSKANAQYLDAVYEASTTLLSADSLGTLLLSYSMFQAYKENKGMERAIGTNIFYSKDLDSVTWGAYSQMVSRQDAYDFVFEHTASDEVLEFEEYALLDQPCVNASLRMREFVLTNNTAGIQMVTLDEWWTNMTEYMNLLLSVQVKVRSEMVERADSFMNEFDNQMMMNVTVLIATISLFLVSCFFVARTDTTRAREVLENLAFEISCCSKRDRLCVVSFLNQIICILCLLMLFILALLVPLSLNQVYTVHFLSPTRDQVNLLSELSFVIHQLQLERGSSAMYYIAQGESNTSTILQEQYYSTDNQLQTFYNYVRHSIPTPVQNTSYYLSLIDQLQNNLNSHREFVCNLTKSERYGLTHVIQFYYDLNGLILDLGFFVSTQYFNNWNDTQNFPVSAVMNESVFSLTGALLSTAIYFDSVEQMLGLYIFPPKEPVVTYNDFLTVMLVQDELFAISDSYLELIPTPTYEETLLEDPQLGQLDTYLTCFVLQRFHDDTCLPTDHEWLAATDPLFALLQGLVDQLNSKGQHGIGLWKATSDNFTLSRFILAGLFCLIWFSSICYVFLRVQLLANAFRAVDMASSPQDPLHTTLLNPVEDPAENSLIGSLISTRDKRDSSHLSQFVGSVPA